MSLSPAASLDAGEERFVVGVDFGTLSGRAVVVRVRDGAELASSVHPYPHGVVEKSLPAIGEVLPPDWALQLPQDWRDVLLTAVPEALAASGIDPVNVIAIGTDFTACTVLPTTGDGTPLCELEQFRGRPHAYPKLWKHHAAQPQADRINRLAEERGEAWLPRYGGRISSEWEFAKALQVLEEDPEVYAATECWVEAADWIVWELCGVYLRNACSAGYKGIYQDGHYPSQEYLAALDPAFAAFAGEKLAHPIGQLGERAGGLTSQAAGWTGLPEGIAVCVGNVDAHVTAPAARATGPGQLLAVMGTSTCHVMSSDRLGEIAGMCGVVDGGIIPGLWGYEAGQSGVGDIFGWFVDTSVPASYSAAAKTRGLGLHEYLTELAAGQPVGAHGLVALDWHSGNRSVLVDHELSGVIVGQTLATRPEETYRALLEATAFGTRTIIEAFERGGVPVSEIVVAGGLVKNAFLMQLYADVCRRPLSVVGSSQGPALGSAIFAAVAAGAYADVQAASDVMGASRGTTFRPDEQRAAAYDALYVEYVTLHDYFGRGGNDVLHRLRALRRDALKGAAGAAVPDASRPEHDERGTQRRQRERVAALHLELVRNGLVTWTAGNISERVPGADLFVIKASGVSYDDLTWEGITVCDLDGNVVDGLGKPSSDTGAHAYIYRHLPEVNGVVHTHSPYATAWAARGEEIPCVLTAMADEFGGPIPIGTFARIGDESIGRVIVDTLSGSRSPAILLRSHGVFTIGRDARGAVKAAVMTEDVARTVHLARQHGEPLLIPQADIDALYARYQNAYGQ